MPFLHRKVLQGPKRVNAFVKTMIGIDSSPWLFGQFGVIPVLRSWTVIFAFWLPSAMSSIK
jgi:hypothetical protein